MHAGPNATIALISRTFMEFLVLRSPVGSGRESTRPDYEFYPGLSTIGIYIVIRYTINRGNPHFAVIDNCRVRKAWKGSCSISEAAA
jgi:hypothetical protein